MALENPTGSFGEAPADAPRETTAPLSSSALTEQLARAQQNERPLAPFNPPATPVPAPSDTLNAAAQALSDARAARQAGSVQPAASESDSPTRGVPRPILDPGKTITGGFGPAGEAQYYPVNGLELLEIAKAMVDQLVARIENDLRFSMALTYPRLVAELEFRFFGWAQDKTETVKLVKVDQRTPVEVARDYGDEVCFVVRETKREFTEAGDPLDPPDRMRDALGLPKPAKQMIESGAGRQVVDIPTLPEDAF